MGGDNDIVMLAPFRACPRTPALWTGVPGFEAILSIDQYPFVYPPGPTLSEGGLCAARGGSPVPVADLSASPRVRVVAPLPRGVRT